MQLEDYQEELEEMKNMTRQEYVAHLRRYSTYVRTQFDLASYQSMHAAAASDA